MKKIVLVFFLLISLSLFSQIPDLNIWNNLRNSGYTSEDSIVVRYETMELPGLEQEFYYSISSGWEMLEPQLLYNLTFQNSIPYNSDAATYCRMRAVVDSMTVLMPAYQENNAMPSSIEMLAKISDQAINDTLTGTNPNLDIVTDYCGFSDDKIFTGIESANQTYPTNSGGYIPSEYYFYISSLINLESAMEDTVGYAMVYGNIPLLISSGLYRIVGSELNLDSFVQIGEIETAEIDGRLVMSCNIEDLINDEYFGEWPNISNSLANINFTAKFSLPTNFVLTDFAMPSVMIMKKFGIEPFDNQLPELSNLTHNEVGELHYINVDYFDIDANFPLVATIETDAGETFELLPSSFIYTETVNFNASFSANLFDTFSVSFSDNNTDFVTLESTGSEDTEITSIFNLGNYPNPFNPETIIFFELPESGQVKLEIYNIKGQKIKQLVSNSANQFSEGEHSVVWDGTDNQNKSVSSGVYFYTLKLGDRVVANKRMLLLK